MDKLATSHVAEPAGSSHKKLPGRRETLRVRRYPDDARHSAKTLPRRPETFRLKRYLRDAPQPGQSQ